MKLDIEIKVPLRKTIQIEQILLRFVVNLIDMD